MSHQPPPPPPPLPSLTNYPPPPPLPLLTNYPPPPPLLPNYPPPPPLLPNLPPPPPLLPNHPPPPPLLPNYPPPPYPFPKSHGNTQNTNNNNISNASQQNVMPSNQKLAKVTCQRCNKEMLELLYDSHVTSHSNEILPWLYLGAERNTKEVWGANKERFTHVISVAEEVPNLTSADDSIDQQNNSVRKWTQAKVGDICQYHVAIKDLPGQDMSVFSDMADEIAKLKEEFGDRLKILVHCVQGISRSTSVILAYLIKCNNMTLKEAYKFVRERRPIANPRKEFIGELQNIERKVYGLEKPTLLVEETLVGTIWINVDPKT